MVLLGDNSVEKSGPICPAVCRFADTFIGEDFGPVVQAVCRLLTARGQQTLRELVRGAGGLPAGAVRSALLVLVQHSLVDVCLVQPEATLRAAPPPYYRYEASAASIAQWLRKPHVLLRVAREFGGGGGGSGAGAQDGGAVPCAIVQALLRNGRLRFDQIMGAAAAALGRPKEDARGDVAATFVALLRERYLERTPPCGLPPRPCTLHTKARKSAPKAGSEEAAAAEAEAAKQLARVTYQASRFALPEGLLTGPAAAPPPKKRKRDAAGEKAMGAEGASAAEPLWRINMEEVNRRQQHDAVARHVADTWGEPAGALAGALLHCARLQQPGGGGAELLGVPAAQAAQAANWRAEEGAPPVTAAQAARRLAELAQAEACPVVSTAPGAFAVDVRAATRALRQQHTEAVVRDRFPPLGARIWRLLVARRQLEQKQVADCAMVTLNDAREVLYRLLRAGFVSLQDVPRTADHAASRTFYTWRVDGPAMRAQLARELLGAACNLRARFRHECAQHWEAVREVEQDGGVNLSEEDRGKLGHMRRACDELDACLMLLDTQIALFHDYP